MLRQLISYDADGNALRVLDHMVALDKDRNVIGLVDFEAHELAGGRLSEIWVHSKAVGSGTWPEWLTDVKGFTVELDPDPYPARARIKALVHKKSGHRRERAAIEAEIEKRISAKRDEAKKRGDEMRKDLKRRGLAAEMVELVQDPEPEAADIRDIVGGPNRPLLLDENGRTKVRVKTQRPNLPTVQRGKADRIAR